MTTKRVNPLIFVIISLIFSLCILGFVGDSLVVYAEESSTSEIEYTDSAEKIADKTNKDVKEWVATVLGALDLILSTSIIAKLAVNKKQSVAVTVNDSETQNKLEQVSQENANMREVLMAMLTIEKGTQEIFKALYADNPNFDDKIHNIINTAYNNSEAVIKDVNDIFGKESKNKVKQALEVVSNIVLG